ncbi:MAG: 3-oxoacyl-ACP synthase [Ahrensia sp.]|nr:3-oxoacyl-ACP synthase [Ahrensia sp.]|tara:strand:- start:5965 stop:6966 length:1002 start_codon:yes stop_codon:yes gene_type:complete
MTMHQATGLAILGTGRALPKREASSAELDRTHGYEPGWLEARTGVATRYFCDHENQIDLAAEAARKALDEAGLRAQHLDVIICAAAVPYQPIPATAPAVQRALGIDDGQCFATDVNSTCLGFPVALHLAEGLLGNARYSKILVVSSEVASRGLPWEAQPGVAGLFGDGAGAAVIGEGDHSGILAAQFATWPSGYEACTIGSGGTRFDFEKEAELFAANSKFTMDGKELFRLTAKHFGSFVSELLERANTKREDIVRVIAHQASPGALAHMAKICDFREEQVVNIAARFGNQISASIPFTLDYARKTGAVRRGDRIVILGTSAGVSFGGLVMDL